MDLNMEQKPRISLLGKIKKFIVKLSDDIDKKMERDAQSKSCCGKSGEGKDKSCCS